MITVWRLGDRLLDQIFERKRGVEEWRRTSKLGFVYVSIYIYIESDILKIFREKESEREREIAELVVKAEKES